MGYAPHSNRHRAIARVRHLLVSAGDAPRVITPFSEVGCTTAQLVGERRGLRATAEQPQSGERSGIELDRNSRAQPPSSGDCD